MYLYMWIFVDIYSCELWIRCVVYVCIRCDVELWICGVVYLWGCVFVSVLMYIVVHVGCCGCVALCICGRV